MKPGTYTQLYTQLVFAPKNRNAVLTKEIRDTIFKYIGGIITAMDHKSYIVNGAADHVHIFYGQNPTISISDTVHEIKRVSSLFINKEKLCPGRFAWQEGYGAFSYSRSHRERVWNYLMNQEKHHQKQNFKNEYLQLLKSFDIPFDEKYLFQFWDDV